MRQYQTEEELLAGLRRGEEPAFAALLDRYYRPMLRLAMTQVHSRAHAEDVVQEAWLGVLRGIDRFESRSSLRTWIFHILAVLPPMQRAGITLRDIHGLTTPEVAAVQGVPEGHLRVLVHRARSKVRRVLEQFGRA